MTVLKVLVPPALLLLSVASAISSAQTVSFALASGAGAPGDTVSLNLSLNSTTGSEPAGVQWTLSYSATDFSAVVITDGAAATAAGKSASCATGVGSIICLSSGINANTIAEICVAMTMRCRLKRSATTPPTGERRNTGIWLEKPTIPSSAEEPVSL